MFNCKCPTCNKCINKKLIFSTFINNKPNKCESCSNIFVITNMSRFLVISLMFLPILFQNYIFDICGNYSIIIYLLWVIFVFIISPLLLKVESKRYKQKN